jgi:uncharacterized repeat protein (TIGR02543 family)
MFGSAYSGTWELNTLRMDGGGWVTGMVIHPDDPTAKYVRTDVGGAFRWNPTKEMWESISDWIPPYYTGLYGVDAIAIDPNNTDVVYMALGRGTNSYNGIYKSTDRGESFTQLPFPHSSIDGNDHALNQVRTTGERLVVSPFDSDEILYAMLKSPGGVWRTTDGGQNWTDLGLSADNLNIVLFDKFNQGHIYVNSLRASGVYVSTNSGGNWNKLQMASGGDCPANDVRRMEQSSDGTIYFTNGDGSNAVYKIVNTKAYDITPTAAEWNTVPSRYQAKHYWTEEKGFQGIAINPNDPNHIICEGAISSCKDIYPVAWFESMDGGDTWVMMDYIRGYYTPWGSENNLMKSTVTDLVWDLEDPRFVWHMDGSGIARMDVTTPEPHVANEYVQGVEEIVTKEVTSVPVYGEERIFSGGADVGGFYHNNGIDLPPDSCIHDYWLGKTGRHAIMAFDYCESQPNHIWVAGRHNYTQKSTYRDPSRRGGAYYAIFHSSDGGDNFTMLPWLQNEEPYAPWPIQRNNFDADINPLELKVSSTDPDNMVVVGQNPSYTKDGGGSWHSCSGLGDYAQEQIFQFSTTLENDPIDGNTFYAYVPFKDANKVVINAKFYKSTDGGANWDVVKDNHPILQSAWRYLNIKATPGVQGNLWISGGKEGLAHTTDGGSTWTMIPGWTDEDNGAARISSVGVGPAGTVSAVFVLGEYYGESGLWLSTDEGTTWEKISKPGVVLANYYFMEASNYAFGKVYMSSSGQGMRYFSNNDHLTVSPNDIAVGKEATSEVINITSNTNWTVSSDKTWATPVTTSGTENGSVTINIDANTGEFAREATITVAATDATDKYVTITQAGSLEYELNTTATNGTIELDPVGGVYPPNTNVLITAVADSGYIFDSWSGDATGTTNPTSILMDGNKSITANFSQIETFELTVHATNGNVIVEPAGTVFNEGTVVTLTANPNSGFEFKDWSGSISGTTNPVQVTMDGNKDITANFVEPSDITLQAEDADIINSASVETAYSGYNGTGYVKFGGGGSFEFTDVAVPAGTFDVVIRSLEDWPDASQLIVNGTTYDFELPGGGEGTTTWMETTITDVTFQSSGNSIKVYDGKQQKIDQIKIVGIVTTDNPIETPDVPKIKVKPNPVVDGVLYFTQKANYKIYNTFGSTVLSGTNSHRVDVAGLKPGLYFVNTNGIIHKVIIK